MARSSRFWFCVATAVAFGPGALLADVTGSILGTVRDPSAAVIQGVRIVATNVDTNLVTEAITDPAGQYRILSLPVGHYTVQASFSGFQAFVATGIVLSVDE